MSEISVLCSYQMVLQLLLLTVWRNVACTFIILTLESFACKVQPVLQSSVGVTKTMKVVVGNPVASEHWAYAHQEGALLKVWHKILISGQRLGDYIVCPIGPCLSFLVSILQFGTESTS